MAYICAYTACILMGVSVITVVLGIQKQHVQSITQKVSRPRQLKERFYALVELLGHKPQLIKLSRREFVEPLLKRLHEMLTEYGFEFTCFGSLAFVFILTISFMLAGVFISHSLFGIPVGLVLCATLLVTLVGRYESRLHKQEIEQMPEVLRILSAALGAGKSLPQAIEYAGQNLTEPFGSQFLQASFEIKGGCSVEEAVDALCGRVHAPGIALLATALTISQRTGSPLDELLMRTARMVTSNVALRRELDVKTSQARLSAKVVSVIPVLLAAVLTLLSPDYRAGLSTSIGSTSICIAILMDVLALLIIRSLMNRSVL
ncbi:MAG: type II secretion system F family protein [Coriobacteriales bacterium]|nr:type II secretion system F family protein [Coriobacteriales bacterium]